jgi:hypothetical protein
LQHFSHYQTTPEDWARAKLSAIDAATLSGFCKVRSRYNFSILFALCNEDELFTRSDHNSRGSSQLPRLENIDLKERSAVVRAK